MLLLLLFDDEHGVGLALYEIVHSYYILMGAVSNFPQYRMLSSRDLVKDRGSKSGRDAHSSFSSDGE